MTIKPTAPAVARKPSARSLAWEILNRVSENQAWAEDLLSSRLAAAQLSRLDERLCRELCFGVIKMQGLLDYALAAFWRQKQIPPVRLLNLLRLGAYQLLLLSKVPAHAAVYETVELAKTQLPQGQIKMANAVLRALTRSGMRPLPDRKQNPVQYLAVKYSFPEYVVRRWLSRWSETECEALLAAANEPPALWARVNTTRATREEVLAALQAQGVEAHPGLLPTSVHILPGAQAPAEISGVAEGKIYFQDQGSQLIGWLVDPEPGQTCLDVCSAPGGKATHLAELMQGTGKVWAYDHKAQKLKRVEENARRLHLENVSTTGRLPEGLPAHRVLVDAPCSGLGTLRRHAEIRWRLEEPDHARLGKKQLEILEQSAAHVQPGGHLIYSTCTTEPEENEEVVKAFLSRQPEFALLPGPGSSHLPGPEFWDKDGFFRTHPRLPDWDGMFAARMKRRPV